MALITQRFDLVKRKANPRSGAFKARFAVHFCDMLRAIRNVDSAPTHWSLLCLPQYPRHYQIIQLLLRLAEGANRWRDERLSRIIMRKQGESCLCKRVEGVRRRRRKILMGAVVAAAHLRIRNCTRKRICWQRPLDCRSTSECVPNGGPRWKLSSW